MSWDESADYSTDVVVPKWNFGKLIAVPGGSGPPGPKGDTGAVGPVGPQGERGEQGPTTVTVGSTTTGEAGTEASVSNSGTGQDAVLDFVIPRGEQGPVGPPADPLTVSMVQTAAPNLLLDGSYERDAAWWAGELKAGVELSTEQKFLGAQSLKLTGPVSHYPNVTATGKTGNDPVYGMVRSAAGRLYRVSFRVFRPATNSGDGYIRCQLAYRGSNGQDLGGGFGPTNVVNQSDIPAGVWFEYVNTFMVPRTGTNSPYMGVAPLISVAAVGAADVFYIDTVRFDDVSDSPVEVVAPPPTGDRAIDTANLQRLLDFAQTNRGTLVLRAGTYAADLVTKKLDRQPRIIGQGKNYTKIDGTIKYVGVSSKISGGHLSGFSFTGNHAGKAALELNGACDVHWDQLRVEGTYDVGVLFHNEGVTNGVADFTEICNGEMDVYITVKTAVKYLVTGGHGSFHGSGLTGDSKLQHGGNGPLIHIGANALPYNAPLSGRVWIGNSATYPMIQHDGQTISNFFGNLTVEQNERNVPLAAGNTVYYAGTLNTYLGSEPDLVLDYGTLRVIPNAQVKAGKFTIGPLTVNELRDTTGNSVTPGGAARLVAVTAQGASGAEDGTNTWCKIATLTAPNGWDASVVLAVVAGYTSSADTAIVNAYIRGLGDTSNPVVTCNLMSLTGAGRLAADSFKIISGVGGTAELWMRKVGTNLRFSIYEVGKWLGSTATVTYHNNSPWQSATPVGTVNNVSSNGATVGGGRLQLNGENGAVPTIAATSAAGNANINIVPKGASGVVQVNGTQVEVKGHTHTVAQVVGARSWAAVPSSATATGTAGQEAYDADFHYVCVATNTWKRTPLTTW